MKTTTPLCFVFVAAALAACGDPVIDGDHFDVLAIETVEPLVGPSTGGTTITVRIRAGCDAPSLTFGGAQARDVRLVSDGVVTAKTPAHAIGDAEIVATCGAFESEPFSSTFRFSARAITIAPTIGLPFWQHDLRVADFDGDDLDDIAVVEADARRVAVYPATGTGGVDTVPAFEIPLDDALWVEGARISVSDLSGDGRPDLVVSAIDEDAKTVRVQAKHSDDGFGALHELVVSRVELTPAAALTAVDIDGDGRADPLVLEYENGMFESVLVLHLSASGEPLVLGNANRASWEPQIVDGDFDGDGVTDLMIVDFGFGRHVMGGPTPTIATFDITEVRTQIAYVNNDAWPDLLYDGDPGTTGVFVELGTGTGTFDPRQLTQSPCGDSCRSIGDLSHEPLDLDGNGEPDYLLDAFGAGGLYFVEYTTGRAELVAEGGNIVAFPKLVPGQRPAAIYRTQDGLRAAFFGPPTVSDTGDVRIDVVPPLLDSTGWACYGDFEGRKIALGPAAGAPGTMWLRESAPGTSLGAPQPFAMPTSLPMVGPAICMPARFDAETVGFLLFVDTDEGIAIMIDANDRIETEELPMQGGTLLWASVTRPGFADSVGIAQLVPTVDGLLYRHGTRTEQGLEIADSILGDAGVVATPLLFDADDIPDFVVETDGVPLLVGVRAADGTLTVRRRALAPGLAGVERIREVDLDGDGDWDLAVTTANAIVLFENDGDGGVTEIERLDRGGVDRIIGACDLDADRAADLFVTTRDSVGIVRRAEPGAPFLPLSLWSYDVFPPTVSVATDTCSDVDADGLPDVVHFDITAGKTRVFFNRSK